MNMLVSSVRKIGRGPGNWGISTTSVGLTRSKYRTDQVGAVRDFERYGRVAKRQLFVVELIDECRDVETDQRPGDIGGRH